MRRAGNVLMCGVVVVMFGACGGSDLGSAIAALDPTFPGLPTDAIEAPTSGTDLPGMLSVAGNGAATYDIPIRVPTGRMGMQPSLAFHYSSSGGSSGGNGYAGVGFDLSGIPPSIVRCPPTDDRNHRIEVTGDGARSFCWAGQRLIPTSQASTNVEYRTREDAHVRIIAEGPRARPTQWTIETRDGHTHIFGARVEPRRWFHTGLAGTTAGLRSEVGHTIEWAVSRTVDLHANVVEYLWQTDYGRPLGGEFWYEHRLGEIRYAGDSRIVRFEYEQRPDVREAWNSGFMRRISERLFRVRVLAPDVDGGEPVEQWFYRLVYDSLSSTGRSRVIRVRHCAGSPGGGPFCNVTRFSWSSGGTAVRQEGTFIAASGASTGDFNGDGLDDLLFRYRSDLSELSSDWRLATASDRFLGTFGISDPLPFDNTPIVVDADADGRSDVLAVDHAVDDSGLLSCLGTPGAPLSCAQYGRGEPSCYRPYVVFDEGGGSRDTGRLEFVPNRCFARTDGAYAIRWALYAYSTSARSLIERQVFPIDPLRSTAAVPAIHVADFDANGTLDMMYGSDEDVWFGRVGTGRAGTPFEDFATPVGAGLSAPEFRRPCPTGVGGPREPAGPSFTMDTDGDGRSEYLVPRSAYDSVALDEFAAPGTAVDTNLDFAGNNYVMMDVNGDGLTDVVDLAVHEGYRPATTRAARSLRVRFNMGTGFGLWYDAVASGSRYDPPFVTPTCNTHESIDERVRVLDYNADGLSDFIVLGERPAVYVSTGRQFVRQALPFGFDDTPIDRGDGELAPLFVTLDADGNGQVDFLVGQASTDFDQLYLRTDAPPDVMTAVSSTRGARDTIEYDRLGAVRLGDLPSCAYPLGCTSSRTRVVSRIRRDNGLGEPGSVGSAVEETFRYEGGLYDQFGGGFLGFRRIRRSRLSAAAVEEALEERVYFAPDPQEVGEPGEPGHLCGRRPD